MAGSKAVGNQIFEVPIAILPVAHFTGDVVALQKKIDELTQKLDALVPAGQNETIRLVLLRRYRDELIQLGVGPAIIQDSELHAPETIENFKHVLFQVADELVASGEMREALFLLARFASSINANGDIIAYDPQQIENLQSTGEIVCAYGTQGSTWAEHTWTELEMSLTNDNLVCRGIPTCTHVSEFHHPLTISNDPHSRTISLSGAANHFDNLIVDIYCDLDKRETLSFTPMNGFFTSGPVALCASNADTVLKWRAESTRWCRAGIGAAVIPTKPVIAAQLKIPDKTKRPFEVPPNKWIDEVSTGGAREVAKGILLAKPPAKRLQVVVLLDRSGSMGDDIKDIRDLTPELIELGWQQAERFDIALWSFSDNGEKIEIKQHIPLGQEKTKGDQVAVLTTKTEAIIDDLGGGTEAIWQALDKIMRRTHFDYHKGTRRKIIVLTDEWGNFSKGHHPLRTAKRERRKRVEIEIRKGPAGLVYTLAQQVRAGTLSRRDFEAAVSDWGDELHLNDGATWAIIQSAIPQMTDPNIEVRQHALSLLSQAVPELSQERGYKLAVQLWPLMTHEHPEISDTALALIIQVAGTASDSGRTFQNSWLLVPLLKATQGEKHEKVIAATRQVLTSDGFYLWKGLVDLLLDDNPGWRGVAWGLLEEFVPQAPTAARHFVAMQLLDDLPKVTNPEVLKKVDILLMEIDSHTTRPTGEDVARREIAMKAAELVCYQKSTVRDIARSVLKRVMPKLSGEDCHQDWKWAVDLLANEDPELRHMAAELLERVIPKLSKEDGSKIAWRFADLAERESVEVSESAFALLKKVAPLLSGKEGEKIVQKYTQKITHSYWSPATITRVVTSLCHFALAINQGENVQFALAQAFIAGLDRQVDTRWRAAYYSGLQHIIPALSPANQLSLLQPLDQHLPRGEVDYYEYRSLVLNIADLGQTVPLISDASARRNFSTKVASFLNVDDLSVRNAAIEALGRIVPTLPDPAERKKYATLIETAVDHNMVGAAFVAVGVMDDVDQMIVSTALDRIRSTLQNGEVDEIPDGLVDQAGDDQSAKRELTPVSRAPLLPQQPHPLPDGDVRKNFALRPAEQPLDVNASLPHYFSQRLPGQIVADLQGLSRRPAPTEEAFLTVVGVRRASIGDELVQDTYEVGIGEIPTQVSIQLDSQLIRGAQTTFASVARMSMEHFHPKDPPGMRGSEYPSPQDFKSILAQAHISHEIGFPEDVFDFRVTTTTGVFVMKPDCTAINANPDDAKKQFKKYERIFTNFTLEASSRLQRLNQAEKSAQFAVRVSSEFVGIRFEPFR